MTLKVSRKRRYPEIQSTEFSLSIVLSILVLLFSCWMYGFVLKIGMSFFSRRLDMMLELLGLVLLVVGAVCAAMHNLYIQAPVVLRGNGVVRRRWSFFEVQTIIAEPCYFEIVEDVYTSYYGNKKRDMYNLYLRGPEGGMKINSAWDVYNYISISKELGIPIKMKRLGGCEEWLD